jgi:hypothetical protein
MAVTRQYREIYSCDLESERSISWGEGTLCYCKENGGNWWKIESGVWVEKVNENSGAAGSVAWSGITGTLSNQTDLQNVLDGKSANGHNHNASYEPINSNIQTHITSSHAPSDAQKNSDITKAEIEAKLTGQISSHTHAGGSEAFPVGAIYISVLSSNPSVQLGYGTWVAFGAGKMLVGFDAADVDFDTEEEVGGAKTKTHSVAEMPAHSHVQDAHTHVQNAHNHIQRYNVATTGPLSGPVTAPDTSSNTTTNYGITTADTTAVNQNATAVNQNTGGGQAFSIMNPYIVVRFWKRTA